MFWLYSGCDWACSDLFWEMF